MLKRTSGGAADSAHIAAKQQRNPPACLRTGSRSGLVHVIGDCGASGQPTSSWHGTLAAAELLTMVQPWRPIRAAEREIYEGSHAAAEERYGALRGEPRAKRPRFRRNRWTSAGTVLEAGNSGPRHLVLSLNVCRDRGDSRA